MAISALTPNIDSQVSVSVLAQKINFQDWMDLGKPFHPSYCADPIKMKENLCALLYFRLEKIIHAENSSFRNGSLYDSLYSYVERICDLYIANDYHNFQHAYHVTISVNKLVDLTIQNEQLLHDDYLVHFALVFTALVHDVGHKGIPNFILIKLEDELAKRYNNTSIAEKNSLKIAFDILDDDIYSSLRRKIFGPDNVDFIKFQSIVRTAILCTDVFNAGRMNLVKDRWEIAFTGQNSNSRHFLHSNERNDTDDLNKIEIDKICVFPEDSYADCLQKTSAIEHLIQVADVAHNFQSWEVFMEWNYRLVRELHVSHQSGWMGDVVSTWNDGQQKFTDTYILPLILRVREMGILSDSDYNKIYEAVERIREKWGKDGDEICKTMQFGIKMGEDEVIVLEKLLTPQALAA